jgi:hypothetical protein
MFPDPEPGQSAAAAAGRGRRSSAGVPLEPLAGRTQADAGRCRLAGSWRRHSPGAQPRCRRPPASPSGNFGFIPAVDVSGSGPGRPAAAAARWGRRSYSGGPLDHWLSEHPRMLVVASQRGPAAPRLSSHFNGNARRRHHPAGRLHFDLVFPDAPGAPTTSIRLPDRHSSPVASFEAGSPPPNSDSLVSMPMPAGPPFGKAGSLPFECPFHNRLANGAVTVAWPSVLRDRARPSIEAVEFKKSWPLPLPCSSRAMSTLLPQSRDPKLELSQSRLWRPFRLGESFPEAQNEDFAKPEFWLLTQWV